MATSKRSKLPRVSQYVKNVGKSVVYLSIDAITANTPGINEFMEENNDFFREMYAGAKSIKKMIKNADKTVKETNIYKAIDTGIRNTMDDLRTGNLYNTTREKENAEMIMGLDDESLGLDMDFNVSFDDDDEESNEDHSDAFIVSGSIKSAAMGVSTAAAKGTDMIVKSNKASTKLLSVYIEKSTATIHSGLGAVYSAVDRVSKILNGPMVAHMENSKTYYETSTNLLQENTALIKELVEMQRNIYQENKSGYRTTNLDNILSGGGNIKAYVKNIVDNVKDSLGAFGIMDMGANLPMMIAQAPLKLVLSEIAGAVMPKNFKKNLKSFDTGISSLFSQIIATANNKKNDYSGNMVIDKIIEMLGVSVRDKKDINTANYKKGPVPFDGVTRKSIVEVIPGYLARIEAALTGRSERYFDPEMGRWRTIDNIKAEFESDKAYNIRRANYDLFTDGNKLIRTIKDPKKAKEMEEQIRYAAEIIYKDGGHFAPNIIYPNKNQGNSKRSTSGDAYKYYGFKSKEQFDIFINSLSMDTIRGLAQSNMRAKESYAKRMQDYEENGGVYNLLFNNSIEAKKNDDNRANTGSMHRNILTLTQDNHGNSIYDYLRMILDSLRGKGGRSTKSGGNPPTGGSPDGTYRRKRSKRTKRSKKSTESEGDSGSDTEDDPWAQAQARIEEEDKEAQANTEKKDTFKNWLEKKFEKSAVGKLFLKITDGASNIIATPMRYATELLEKADKSLFHMMFGDGVLRDKDGKDVGNVFEYIIDKIKTAFEDLGKWVKEKFRKYFDPWYEKVKDKAKPFYDRYGKPIKDELTNMRRAASARIKLGVNNTFGKAVDIATAQKDGRMDDYNVAAEFGNEASKATGDGSRDIIQRVYNRTMTKDEWKRYNSAIRKARRGGVVSANEVSGTATKEDTNDPGVIETNAFGTRYVTKRGLTMISPGEVIIPASFDKNEQNKMLALEKKDRKRIADYIGLNAKGTVNTDDFKNTLRSIYNDNKDPKNMAKIGAKGIVGGGLGLLMGNPLLGALAGAGLSILENSNTLKDIVFGEIGKDGKRGVGGLIPKHIQEYFQKAIPDMTDFGIAGGILGLFTPFGILGGAAMGAGLGMLKNNDSFKEFIFGSETAEGLISKETYDKFVAHVKKSAPSMLIGAGLGVLTGPFGLLGNAAMGAGLGMITTTNEFHKFLFGDEETGAIGLLSAFKTGFMDPAKDKLIEFTLDFKDYAQKHILNPMKNFWDPFKQMMINVIRGIPEAIGDMLTSTFDKFVGLPINDFLQEKVFKPASKLIFGILKAPYKIGRAALSAPFRIAGQIGDSMRASQIRRGKAYNMSASERLAFRQQHKMRFNGFTGSFFKDKTKNEDLILASMNEEDLESVFTNARAGLNSYTSLQKATIKTHDDLGRTVSGFFNEKDDDGSTKYARVDYKLVDKMTKAAQKGNMKAVDKYIEKMEGLTKEEKDQLKAKIEDKVNAARLANETMANAKEGTDAMDKKLGKLLNRKVKGKKDRRQLMKAAEAEIRARKKLKRITDDASKNSIETLDDFSQFYQKRTDAIIGHLRSTNEILCKLLDPNYESENDNNSDGVDTPDIETPNEDSKESKDEEARLEEDEQEDDENIEANKKTASAMDKLKDYLMGKKDPKPKEFGILSKIGGFLGIAGFAAKVSLFGHATEWVKNNIWPKFKSFLFGNEEDPGLIGRLKTMFGGLFDKAGTWIGEKINSITNWLSSKGGLKGILLNDIVPGFVNGITYAANNLVAPITSIIIKCLPGIAKGLIDGIITGISSIFNKKISDREPFFNEGEATKELNRYRNDANAAFEAGDTTGIVAATKSLFNGLSISTASSNQNDNNGANVGGGSFGTVNNDRISASIFGLLGQTKRTNQVQIDENGNVITDYTQFNTTDSVFSKALKTGGRAFLKGLGGTFKAGKRAKGIVKSTTKGVVDFVLPGVANKFAGAAHIGSAIVKTGKNMINDSGIAGTKIGEAIRNTTDNVNLSEIQDDTVKGITKIFKNIADNNDIISRIMKCISSITRKETTEAVVKAAIEKIGDKIANKILKSATKSVLKSVGNIIAKFSPLTLLTFVADFIWGYDNAHTILGVAKGDDTFHVNLAHKVGCGLINIITNYFTLGIISPEFIVDLVMDIILPLFGMTSTKLQEARDNADDMMDEWNKTHPDEQYDNLQDFNNKDKWWYKAFVKPFKTNNTTTVTTTQYTGAASTYAANYQGVTSSPVVSSSYAANPNAGIINQTNNNGRNIGGGSFDKPDSSKNTTTSTNNSAVSTYAASYQGVPSTFVVSSYAANPNTGGARNSHIYQSDYRVANMKYGNSTIGESGCAPVAATNLLNSLDKKSGLADAARYAERRGMTDTNGGTDIGYFNSYLASKGISTTNSSSASTIIKALQDGNQVVMLGMDKNNPNGPFGTTPHFITANGISSSGNIIAEDPDLPNSSIEYRPNDVMKSMMSSVIAKTNKRRGSRRNRRIGFARPGSMAVQAHVNDGGGGGVSNTSTYNISNKLGPEAIIAIAASQIGVAEEGKSNKVIYCKVYYGNDTRQPWCCIFVWWVFNQAGASALLHGGKTASCSTLMERFRSRKKYDKTPRVGDIVFFNFNGGTSTQHVGIVAAINADGTIESIEGNTSSKNEDNGGQVMKKTRKMENVVGFAHPDYPYTYDDSNVVDMTKYGDNTNYKAMALSGIAYSTSNNSSTTLLGALSDLGSSMVKAIYGSDAYEALFGKTINSYNSDDNINTGTETETRYKYIWDHLIRNGYTKAGAAGIMGNLYAESALNPSNIENKYEKSLGSDDAYTAMINKKTYSKNQFIHDKAGYGLAQWTYSDRKKKLYESTIERGRHINDVTAQLDYLVDELASDYSEVNNILKTTSSINDASDKMLLDFEKPAGAQGKKDERRRYSQNMLNKYGSGRNRSFVGGNATRALNAFRDDSTTYTTASTNSSYKAVPVSTNNGAVDYQTFLQTIVTILLTIADNTALLTKILEVLSDNLDMKIDKNEITAAAKSSQDNARKRRENILNNAGSNYGKTLNDNYTNYLISAMTAIASE